MSELEPESLESLNEEYHTAMVAANALYVAIQSLEAERAAYLKVIHNVIGRAWAAGVGNE